MPLIPAPLVGAALMLLAPAVALAQLAAPPSAAESAKSEVDSDGLGKGANGGPLSACRPDLAKFCPDGTKGRRACLQRNASKLSPECTAALADVDAKAKAMREACAGDVQTHCAAGVKGASVVQCLRESRSKLSSGCGAALKARYPNE